MSVLCLKIFATYILLIYAALFRVVIRFIPATILPAVRNVQLPKMCSD
jgi:hypothetical protein